MKKYPLLYIFSFITISNILAQSSNLKFQQYTVTNGIPQSSVNCILQDHEGFMWFGTNRGITRFDGYEFKAYKFNPKDTVNIYGNKISSIYEDSKKRLWIGCVGNDGLYLYNREQDNFECFYNESDDPNSLSSSSIRSIAEDKEGYLWFGTANGLSKLNPKVSLKRFARYMHDENDSTSLCENNINVVYIDSRGYLWIGTETKGLDLFDRTSGKFIHFQHDEKSSNSISNNQVNCIYEATDKSIWIGVNNNLNKILVNEPEKFHPKNVIFTHYKNNSHISSNRINSICQDKTGKFWVSSDNGLREYEIETTNELSLRNYYNYNPQDTEGLLSDFIWSVYFDIFGTMWICTSNGLNKSKDSKFLHYKQHISSGLTSNKIEAILEDKENNIWLATSKGINVFDRTKDTFSNILPGIKAILSICQDSDRYLWFGTWHNGLIQYNPETKIYTRYNYDKQDTTSLKGNNIFSIFEDSKNNLWIAAWGTGVNLFNKANSSFIRYESNDNENSLNSNYVSVIFEDSKNNIWVGTEEGLNLLKNKQEGTFYSYLNNVPNKHSKSVTCIHESKTGILWIGTMNGLYKTNFPHDDFIMYTTVDGLPDNAVMGILEDNNSSLWISFMNGFAKISDINEDNDSIKVSHFDIGDGLQGKEFVARSCWKTQSGEMLFGGRNGFNIFHPDSIKLNTQTPIVLITDFQLFNKNVSIGETINGDTILKKSITQTKEITLSWRNNVFSFHFAALHYTAPMQNQYAYMMEGFDKSWNYTNASRRYASYTNLSHGEYIFKIKASNNDGVWNSVPSEIGLTILPPWWRTTWFKILLAGMFVYSTFLLIRIRTYNLQKRKNLLVQKVKERTQTLEKQKNEIEKMSEQLHEADQMQLRFFTNVSHEFRTPLTLITGPLQKLIESPHPIDSNVLQFHLNLMFRNANRLFRLINQLIDFTKIDQGTKKVNLTHNNIIEFLQEITDVFYPLAEQKQIALKYRHSIEKINFWFDVDIMEKIIYNLLSNAIKYTQERGTVGVQLTVNGKHLPEKDQQSSVPNSSLLIKISDTGIGIHPKDIGKIFDRFFMAEDTATVKKGGTGIGLAYVKELVKLHGGNIFVESIVGKGTTFSITFPIKNKKHKQSDNTQDKQTHIFGLEYTRSILKTYLDEEEKVKPEWKQQSFDICAKENNKQKPLLLIIEDNSDMRSFIKAELKELYKIEEAEDGSEGLKTAKEIIPDIIISDVMMPDIEGTTVCKKLKTDGNTSHIPIILLTAKSGEENVIEGLKTGADDYITKPFNTSILKLKLKNLLDTRTTLREKFSKSISLNPQEYTTTSFDEKFISDAMKIVEENFQEVDFDNQKFVSLLGYSKSFIYNKLKTLTGQSVSEFIRTIRLKKAAKLLLESKKNISEISFYTGFSDPSRFIHYFSKMFGKTPNQFRKKTDI